MYEILGFLNCVHFAYLIQYIVLDKFINTFFATTFNQPFSFKIAYLTVNLF